MDSKERPACLRGSFFLMSGEVTVSKDECLIRNKGWELRNNDGVLRNNTGRFVV